MMPSLGIPRTRRYVWAIPVIGRGAGREGEQLVVLEDRGFGHRAYQYRGARTGAPGRRGRRHGPGQRGRFSGSAAGGTAGQGGMPGTILAVVLNSGKNARAHERKTRLGFSGERVRPESCSHERIRPKASIIDEPSGSGRRINS